MKLYASELSEFNSIFQEEFHHIIKNLKDDRKLDFVLSNTGAFCYSLEYYDTARFEIHHNDTNIIKEYVSLYDSNKELLNDISRYLARHEYCHSCICQSSEELNHFDSNQEEIIKKIQRFNYIGIENKFREFYADFKVLQLFKSIPNSYLDENLKWLKDEDIKWRSYGMLPILTNSAHTRDQLGIYTYLQNLYKFYILNRWTLLKSIFRDVNCILLLEFFQLIFQSFENIIKKFHSFKQKRDAIISLVYFLDRCKFEELIQSNILSEDIREGLYELNFLDLY